ncbi:MAG: hypothetical protein IH900_06160 [Proteobacteria bacterium]|nr:hypothetical protein [Pseudomonadota bacterium]
MGADVLHPGYFSAGLAETDLEIATAIDDELARQREVVELIASENIVSRAVLEAQGSVLTNKTVEGYPGARYHGGAVNVDVVERLAIARAGKLFGCRFANVQPHSGSQANQAVFQALLQPGDAVLAMALIAGPSQINWKSLRRHFSRSRLTMAKPEEVLAVTGYEVGAVSPFGLPTTLPMLVDQSVLAQLSVSIGSGVRATTIFIKTKDLLRALGEYQSGDFAAA